MLVYMPKFKKDWLPLVRELGSISVEIFEDMFETYVKEVVKQVSDDAIDPSLLRLLCNILENSLEKKDVIDGKINKKSIVLNTYFKLKPQEVKTPENQELLSKLIEDAHNSGAIKKIKTKAKLAHRLRSFFWS
jgi:hypothetical protein